MKKTIIAIILMLIFFITIFSGCLFFALRTYPIITSINTFGNGITFFGLVNPETSIKEHFFVLDFNKHESYQDYEYQIPAEHWVPGNGVIPGEFYTMIFYKDLPYSANNTYHFRAVAYFPDWKNGGWFAGQDVTFTIPLKKV